MDQVDLVVVGHLGSSEERTPQRSADPSGWFRHNGGDVQDDRDEPVSPIDTTGAGEVLAGVFLRLLLLGVGPEVALR